MIRVILLAIGYLLSQETATIGGVLYTACTYSVAGDVHTILIAYPSTCPKVIDL